MISFQQSEPLIHHFIFARSDCFLFEEDGANRSLRHGVIFLPKEIERLTIKILQSPSVQSTQVVLARASDTRSVCTLPDGRVSAASDERLLARIMDEAQQIIFVPKKDDTA